jgi:hypothetical protein
MIEMTLKEAFTKMSNIMREGRKAVKKQVEQEQAGQVVNFTKQTLALLSSSCYL